MTVLLGDDFARILAAARVGQEWAVARLYRSLQPEVLRFLAVREPQEAEDIASQVWLEVAQGLHRFDGNESDFRAFVFTITRRRMLNARRGRARRRSEPQPLESLDLLRAPDDPSEEVSARLDGAAAAQRIAQLLPAEQAEVVLLRVVAGLSVDEVAAVVGRRPATVRVMQHRALQRLAKNLRKDL